MNSHTLVGRVIADPEIKFVGSGTAIASTRISVNRGNGKKNEKGYPESDVFQVKVIGKSAEPFNEHVKKGSVIAVSGRTELSKVKDGAGYWVEVVANSWGFVPKAADAPAQESDF